jgi:hypothetical protein
VMMECVVHQLADIAGAGFPDCLDRLPFRPQR